MSVKGLMNKIIAFEGDAPVAYVYLSKYAFDKRYYVAVSFGTVHGRYVERIEVEGKTPKAALRATYLRLEIDACEQEKKRHLAGRRER